MMNKLQYSIDSGVISFYKFSKLYYWVLIISSSAQLKSKFKVWYYIPSIVGSVVECSPATRAARVRVPDDAILFDA